MLEDLLRPQHLQIAMWLLIFLPLYFIPSIIARFRHKRNVAAIFALNLLLGWTFIGWVVALVWALIHEQAQKEIVQ
jgi:hypothetical protein